MFCKVFVPCFLALWLTCGLVAFGTYLNDRRLVANGAENANPVTMFAISIIGGPIVLGGSLALR